jgi:hypothetical protein
MRRPNKGNAPLATARTSTATDSQSSTAVNQGQLPKGGSVIPHYEPHPLALLFPAMNEESLDKMAKDIKQVGLREPIVLYEGKILDGVQRQVACERANVYPRYSHWENLPEWTRKAGPLAFVISLNQHRRHESPEERKKTAEKLVAAFKAELSEIISDKSETRGKRGRGRPSGGKEAAIKKTAEALNVTTRTVRSDLKAAGIESQPYKKKRERKGKLLNGEDASEREQFEGDVWKAFNKLLKPFGKDREYDVKSRLFKNWFGIYDRTTKDWASPTKVKYADGSEYEIAQVLDDSQRAKLRLQSDKAKKLQPVWSRDETAATGHAPRAKKGGAE